MHHRPAKDKGKYDAKHGRILIAEAPLEAQLQAQCAGCIKTFTHSLPVDVSNGDKYDIWQGGTDLSLEPQPEDLTCLGSLGKNEDLVIDPIEVKSRILPRILQCNESHERTQQTGEHGHWITYRDEITLALDALHDRSGFAHEENATKKYHILVTERCGFHVHVGNGQGVSIPFNAAKKVYSVFVACEKLLDGLVGRRDITGLKLATEKPKSLLARNTDIAPFLFKHAYNKSPSVYLMYVVYMRRQWKDHADHKAKSAAKQGSKHLLDELYPQTAMNVTKDFEEAKFEMDIDSWLMVVKEAEDALDLRGLNCTENRKCTINLKNLPSIKSVPKRMGRSEPYILSKLLTIEFQQDAGTLLAIDALSFIDLVVHLVGWCHHM